MVDMPETGRQAAHILLDAVSAYDADSPARVSAVDLAWQRMNDIGAARATLESDTGVVAIDMSNVLGGALVTMQWLVTLLAEQLDVSREDVLVMAREFLDEE